jgi:WD40 repeat protein/regulator of sirC expression with transglutaminase-like and TPR domain/pimeloyl-ACP methyl ester carboxylesterase
MARNLYALLVGVDRYKAVRSLNGCVNDITAINKFLENRLNQEKYTLHYTELLNESATRDAIISGFRNHLSKAGKEDVVLFYFCGHGAREKAGEEFKDWELDNKHETIVCYDSRSEVNGRRVPDLADKELRYLISQVANKGENSPAHVLVVFDCCHSSSGTRDLEDTDGIRQLDDTASAREYGDFCFADQIPGKVLSPETFPQGNHTFIAACLNTETAKELPLPGISEKRGLFTYSLLKELELQNAAFSYENLIHEVRTRVTGVRLYQNPLLEFIKGIDLENSSRIRLENSEPKPLAFLGDSASIKPRDPSFTLRYRPYARATNSDPEQQEEWILNAGAFQGLQKDMELAVYPEGIKYEDFEISTKNGSETKQIKTGTQKEIARIKIIEVRAAESVVKLVDGRLTQNPGEQFPAIIIKRPVPKVLFYFAEKEVEKDTDRGLLRKVREQLEDWHLLPVGVINDRNQAHQYRLYIRSQQFEIRDGIDDRLLIERFPAEDNDDSIVLAASRVEHIAKWVTTRYLENYNSSIRKDGIEIEVTYQGVTSQEPHLVLYQQSEKPRIHLKIRNQSGCRLFFTLLDICSDYSIADSELLYDGESKVEWIEIQDGVTYTAKYRSNQGKLREDIAIGIPNKYKNLTEYVETLKLIASTHPFTVDQFKLKSLPLSSSDRSIGDDEVQSLPVGDWITKQFRFTFIRSKPSVAINSDTPTELSQGISIQLPDGFSATASLKPASTVSSERSLGSDIELPLLKDAEAFDLIDRRSGDRGISQISNQQLSVLELSGSNLAIDKVTPESPIVISSDRPLEPNEGILALAHDGNFWLPVGYAMPKEDNKTEIKVQHLVTQDKNDTQDGERKISEAISLCFLKVALQKKQTAWLRQATPNSEGTISFTAKGDLESVRKAVAQAERIVLFIHGILGDTESMIPSVQAARLLNSTGSQEPGQYDLILAFDYESLNTKIQDTATILKQQLKQVGLGDGHNKTLHIIAHSMGGLVSRCFIEHQGGNKVVNHLIMLGTPNGGSQWSSVYQLATSLLSVGLNFIPNSFVASPFVSLLTEKGIEKMSTTLNQMNIQESDFLTELRHSNDPQCPYTIIAGDTQLNEELNTKAENLLKALEQKVWKGLEFPFRGQSNDIAVTVESIFTREVFEERNPAVSFIDPIACNHLVYFKDENGLNALARAVRQAFKLPVKLENQAFKGDLTEPDGLTQKKKIVTLKSPTSTQPTTQPQKIHVPLDVSSTTSSNSEIWFDTTHVIALGIDDYQNGVPPLSKAVSDAIEIAKIVEALKPIEKVNYYFSLAPKSNEGNEEKQEIITRLSDNKPSYFPNREGFDKLLSNLEKTIGKNDRIILYFAGHGIALPFVRIPKENGDSTGGQLQVTLDDKPQGYLLLQDAEKGNPETYMKMDNLIDGLKKFECRHGLIILDCCFAGAVEWSLYRSITRQIGDELVTPSILDRYITRNAWQILTSSSENQVTNEDLSLEKKLEKSSRGSDNNSPFVISFKKALIDGEADYRQPKRGFIHATQLAEYLRPKVEDKSVEVNKLQTPCLFPFPMKHQQTAEFVFILGGKKLEEIKKELDKDPDIKKIKNPYLGLESYSPEDYDIFFGRERLIKPLQECVTKNGKQKFPLTVVLGASGSGKSSLVKAGLIHEMFPKEIEAYKKQQTTQKQQTAVIPLWQIVRPGRSPGKTLEEARSKLPISNIPDGKKCLLVIDQIEEVETQCEDPKQKTLFWKELIKLLIGNGAEVDVVLTLRSDFETTLCNQFESALSESPEFKDKFPEGKASNYWVSARFPVRVMEREELEKVITKPAEKHAVFFEDEEKNDGRTLVAQLIHEVAGMPGALPLLSFALYTMYRNFAQRYVNAKKAGGDLIKREITWEDYKSLDGGVPKSLTNRATEEYNNLKYKLDKNGDIVKDQQGNSIKEEKSNAQARQEMLRWVMLRMVTLDGGQVARRRVLQTELEYADSKKNKHLKTEKNKHLKTVIKRFDDARLLVSDEKYVEPAHDALIINWELLREWIKEEEENLILRDRVIPDVREWQKLKDEEKPSNKWQHVSNFSGNFCNWVVKQFLVNGELKRLNKQENAAQKPKNLASKNGHYFESHAVVNVQETVQQDQENLTSIEEAKAEKALSQAYSDNTQHLKSRTRLWDKDSRLDVLGQQLGNLRTSKNSWLNKTEADFVLQSLIKREREKFGWNFLWRCIWGALILLTFLALNEQRNALIEQIRTSRQSAEANLQVNRDLEALTDILRARKTFDNLLLSIFRTEQEFNLGIQLPIRIYIHIPILDIPILDTSWVGIHIGNSEVEQAQVRGTLYKAVYASKERNRFQLDRGIINSVAFHPKKDLLAIAGNRGTIRLFDTTTKKQLQQFPADLVNNGYAANVGVRAIAFTPDGNWLVAGGNKQIKLWKVNNQRKINTSRPLPFNTEGGVIDIAFNSNNNQVAIVTTDNKLRLGTFEKEKLKLGNPRPLKEKFYQVAFPLSKNEAHKYQLVTVGIADEIKLWNTADNDLVEIDNINTNQTNVYSVAFTKNGELATGGEDSTVKFWQIKEEKQSKTEIEELNEQSIPLLKGQQKVFKTPSKIIYGMAFSTNGQLAIFGEDDAVTLFDNSGKTIHTIQPQDTYVNDAIAENMAYSPDGKLVAVIAGGNTIRVWDMESGKQLRRFLIGSEKYGNAISLAFSPSGKKFLVGTDQGYIMLYNASGGELALKHPQWNSKNSESQQVAIQRVMFIPDSSRLAVYGNSKTSNELFLGYYDDVENQYLEKFSQDQSKTKNYQDQNKTNKSSLKDFVFNSKLDRELVIGTEDENTVSLWNTNEIKLLKKIPNQNKVNSVAFSPDDKFFATTDQNGEVKLWNINKLTESKEPQPLLTFPTNQKNIKSIVFNPLDSNSLLTGGEDGTVRSWDISGNKPTQLGQDIEHVKLSSDKKLLAATTTEAKLLMWEGKAGYGFKQKDISGTNLAKGKYTYIAFMPDSDRLLTVGKDFNVKLWDSEGKNFVQLDEEETKQQKVNWVTWSEDGKVLATVGEDKDKKTEKVKLWDFQDDKFQRKNLEKSELENFQKNPGSTSIALSFNGSHLATAEPPPLLGRVKLWDTSQGNKISEFQTQQGTINSIAFSPNGERIVTVGGNPAGKRTLRLWDVSGNPLALIQEDKIDRARFSPDGRLLAGVRDNDLQLMVWDVSDDKFNPLYGQNGQKLDQKFGVKAFEFNEGQLATVGQDGKVSLWQIDEKQLLAQACNLVRGYLEKNPNITESDRELCKNVSSEMVNQDISAGNKILVATLNNPDKLSGVEEIKGGDFAGASEALKASLKSHPNDPEARIYLNNALIGNRNSYTLAVPVPISSNPDGAAEILRGVAQAQKELNERGGINGTLLRVLIADDQGDPKVAEQVAKQIADNTDVLGVVGHFSSDATRQAGEIYKQKQLVAISPVSTAVDPTGLLNFNPHIFGNPYLFRTVPNDRQSAQALARYLWEQLKHKKAVVFFNSNSEYSKSLSSEFEKAFGENGGQVVQKFDVSEPDFDPTQQVKDAINSNSGAQALVLLTDTSKLDATLDVVKANGSLSKPLSLLAGDDIYTLKTLQEGKADAVGMTLAVPWHIDSNPDFANAASSLWKATVNWRTAMAYDATQAFIEALRQNCIAQETKDARECIAQRLRSKDFSVGNGASGQVQFEPSGDRAQESQLVKVVYSGSNSRSRTCYDFEDVRPLPLTDAERNKIQPCPQNAPPPTSASKNGQNSDKPPLSDSRQVNQLNSTSVDAYINRGLTYHRQGNYQQAISNLNKAITLNPNSAKAYSNRAAVYNEQKDYPKAIADSNKAISLNPTYVNAYINRGLAYYHQGNSQQAIANYNKAIQLAPGNAIAYKNRALAYTRLGNQQAAQADRQKAAALSQRQSQ